MTPRTTREAYGQQLQPSSFGREPNPDRPVVVGGIIIAAILACLWAGGSLHDRASRASVRDLVEHQCQMVDALADDRDRVLWHCSDGYRVTSAGLGNKP